MLRVDSDDLVDWSNGREYGTVKVVADFAVVVAAYNSLLLLHVPFVAEHPHSSYPVAFEKEIITVDFVM